MFKDRVFLSPRLERLEVEDVFWDWETPVPRAREERRGEGGAIEAVWWREESRRGAQGGRGGAEGNKLQERCCEKKMCFWCYRKIGRWLGGRELER